MGDGRYEGNGVLATPLEYFASHVHVSPRLEQASHGFFPLHLAFRLLQRSQARVTLGAFLRFSEASDAAKLRFRCRSGEWVKLDVDTVVGDAICDGWIAFGSMAVGINGFVPQIMEGGGL